MKPKALITGATSGIGLAYAKHLAESGHDLVLVARNHDRLGRIAAEIAATSGIDCQVISADLSTPEGVDIVVAAARGVRIDVLVANAGITRAARIGEASLEDVDALMMLLAGGVIRLIEQIAPTMRERRSGNIVVISSIASMIPMPKSAVYAAAKAAVTSYAVSAHHELRNQGVKVTVVNPGYVRTGLHRASGLAHLEQRIPGWLWIDPDDVVRCAERGLETGRASVVPGAVYRVARPFLGSPQAQKLWRRLASRRR
jgi:uncharacterized protein